VDLADFTAAGLQNISPKGSDLDHEEIDYRPTTARYDEPPNQPTDSAHRKAQGQRAKQGGLGFDGQVLKQTIIKKLLSLDHDALAHPLIKCHTEQTVKYCNGCRVPKIFYNRCEVFYCPCCAKRLANDRRKSVEWWTAQITQPKHVVVTTRNTEKISPQRVAHVKAAWAKLRRRAFAKNWRGGFYSLEVTNEGRGWHLHIHALIDATWIDSGRLAAEWASCVGQDFAIVKVMDARQGDYLRELCKYVVDGNSVVKWSPEDLVAYITAFKGQRTFGCFGRLYKLRKEHKTFLESVQADANVCECGCNSFRYFSESEWEWFETINGPNGIRPRVPKALAAGVTLPVDLFG
jgi:hypothetical protein